MTSDERWLSVEEIAGHLGTSKENAVSAKLPILFGE